MRVLISAVLLLAAMPVRADWVMFAETDSARIYLDPSTIRMNGHLRRVWELQDLRRRHPDGELSRRSLQEFDCREEIVRILSASTHSEAMAGGRVLWSYNQPDEWEHIAPGTVAAAALELVCSLGTKHVTPRYDPTNRSF